MLIRRLLILCAMGVFLAMGPAHAAGPTTITSQLKTPINTLTDGDITINTSGSVVIATSSTAAVTINSDNKVVNGGKIENAATTDAIGVLLEGGGADAGFSGTGSITLNGKDATGGIGIEVAASGFTGNILLGTGSVVNVTGGHSTGIAIFGPLVGNVTLEGIVSITGADATGLLVTGPITGTITNSGIVNVRGVATLSTTKTNPQSGSALAIGSDVTGGIYNAGPDSVNTIASAAIIESQGAAPTIYISPSLAGTNAADLTIGVFKDPDSLAVGFSFVNRGTISSAGNEAGVDATAIKIAGDGTHTATLTGGIFSSGIIKAEANSGDKSSNAATVDATAIEIGSGGTVPNIVNTGTISAANGGLGGGTATAVLIDFGGSLSSLSNAGTITATVTDASATGLTLAACAICDYSGTLTSITNTGTINATATPLDNGNEVAIAIDDQLVAAGTSVTFQNQGSVTGDVLFGASDDTVNIEGAGTILGNVSFGGGANVLAIAGTTGTTPTNAILDGIITYDQASGGTLAINIGANGFLKTSSAEATTLNVAAGGNIVFVLGSTGPAPGSGQGIITITGNATFAGSSSISFAFDASLPDTGNYALLYAGGGLTFPIGCTSANAADCVSVSGLPYIYSLKKLLVDTNELDISFARKTGKCSLGQDSKTCLGLTGNEAAIYDPAVAAARGDDIFGAALMNLFTESAVTSALDSLIPDVSGDTRAIAIALTDQATGAVGARQRTMLDYANTNSSLNLWGQEYIHALSNDGSSGGGAGYDGSGFGFAVGADGGSPRNGRFGGAFTFFAGQVQENKPRNSNTNIEWYMVSLYSDWRGHVLFFNTQANGGYGTFTGERVIDVGGLQRKASGNWSDYLASGGFSTGFIFGSGEGFAFIPEWNVDALFVRENAYTETGAKNEGLSINSRDQKSLRAFLGFVMRDNIGIEGGLLEPEIRGGWSYDFLNNPETITASFPAVNNIAGTPFTLTGPTSAASRFVGGASLSWAYRSWSLGFNYDVTASSGAFAHAGTVTLTGRI